mgnify:CR=1 FL=1
MNWSRNISESRLSFDVCEIILLSGSENKMNLHFL